MSASPPPTRSLAVGPQHSSLGTHPVLCASIPGLVPKQLRFCRNYMEIMPSVAEGVRLGVQECQHQFRGRRWNCTTVDSLAIFGPVLDRGKWLRLVVGRALGRLATQPPRILLTVSPPCGDGEAGTGREKETDTHRKTDMDREGDRQWREK